VDVGAFVDRVNPTEQEIRRWAYTTAFEPMQDWQLIIGGSEHAQTLIDLVSDPDCPSRRYLLGALYILVGDAVRSGYLTTPREELDRLLAIAAARPDPWLSTWVSRSSRLVASPREFDYADWCDGGLAATPVPPLDR
jgi:hypothetical protein